MDAWRSTSAVNRTHEALARVVAAWIALSIPAAAMPATAIRNVNLVDVAGGRILPGQTVVTDGGRIVAVGVDTTIPSGAAVIDGNGGYLAPGLVNAHMHLGDSSGDLLLYLACGVTTVRSMDGRPEHVAIRSDVLSGVLEGPTIYTSGPILYGNEPDWDEAPDVRAAAHRIVQAHVARGYDFVKVYFQLSVAQYEAILAAADSAGLPVVGHVPWAVGLERVLEGPQLTNEHLTGYDVHLQPPGSRVRDIHTAWGEILRYQQLDTTRIAGIAARAARSGMWEVPTLVVYEVWNRPDEIAALLADERRMNALSPETRREWNTYTRWQIPKLDEQTVEDRERMRVAVLHRRGLLKALHDAGVKLALGTDGPGARFVYPGTSVHQELAAYVAAGLSSAEALRAATMGGAAALGHPGEFGEIKVGQRADLILLGGDPLADVRRTRDLKGVMVRGRWYGEEALDRLPGGGP